MYCHSGGNYFTLDYNRWQVTAAQFFFLMYWFYTLKSEKNMNQYFLKFAHPKGTLIQIRKSTNFFLFIATSWAAEIVECVSKYMDRSSKNLQSFSSY